MHLGLDNLCFGPGASSGTLDRFEWCATTPKAGRKSARDQGEQRLVVRDGCREAGRAVVLDLVPPPSHRGAAPVEAKQHYGT